MYIEEGLVPVLEGFGELLTGRLLSQSRVFVPAGTELIVRGYEDGGAEKPDVMIALPEASSATLEDIVGVTGGPVVGRDLVSVGGQVVLDADVKVSGDVWHVASLLLKDAGGGQLDVFIPRGTEVLIQEIGSGGTVTPLPGDGDDGDVVVDRLPSTAEMNAIWNRRALRAGYSAGAAATVGTAATFALAASGRKKSAIAAGVVGVLAVGTAVGVALFAKSKVVRETV